MRPDFELVVVTPDGSLFRGPVTALRLPGIDGDLGVLAGHAPMVAALRCGITHVDHAEEHAEQIATGDGYAEVRGERTRLIIEFLNGSDDVDRDRAHGALQRARARLVEREESLDLARAEAALCRAVTRLKVCGCGCSLCQP